MGLDPHDILSPLVCGRRKVVVAVSGGSDSLGLLMLAAGFFGDSGHVLAVTVDHGLRPEGAAEARAMAALCARHGIPHRTMAWLGEKPRSGVIAAAREARYALLAQAAADAGADTILIAHTMDDQAETVAMRARRRDGGAGLAGMAEVTLYDGRFRIVRPLLSLRRQAIRDFLAARGVAWIDDPTNRDDAYERVRVRAALSDAEVEALAARARAEGEARTRLAHEAAALVERHAARAAPGLFRLDPALFADATEASVLALRALLAMVGGTPRLPDRTRARDLFSRLAAEKNLRATLSRVVADRRRSGIWLHREARDLPPLRLCAVATVWDGRWLVRGVPGSDAGAAPPLTPPHNGEGDSDRLRPLERTGTTFQDPPPHCGEGSVVGVPPNEPVAFCPPESLVRAAAAAHPAAAQPFTAVPVVAPYARFLPGFDLKLAGVLARLAGAPPPPATPWKHHIEA